jgi:hypothetical protein
VGDLSVNGSIILKQISVAGSFGHGNDTSGQVIKFFTSRLTNIFSGTNLFMTLVG